MKLLRLEEVTHFPEPRELTPEERKELLALSRAQFTADDLQKFTEVLEGPDAEESLREFEEAQKEFEQRAP
jgi:hypothetical protein